MHLPLALAPLLAGWLLWWAPPRPALEYGARPAEVTQVLDGDTIVLRFAGADDGDLLEYRANLIGVDAPEQGEAECEARRITAIVRRLLIGKRVWIAWDSADKRTGNGRLLVYVAHGEDHDADLNALYIEWGWAWVPRAWPFDRRDACLALEEKARRLGRGVWGGPCPPTP